MNREILFRGKSLLTGEWIESGSLRQWDNGCVGLVHPARRTEKVDPDTVGQYTGLKDRNGTQIFEGDVIEYDTFIGTWVKTVRAVVVWDRSAWALRQTGYSFLVELDGVDDMDVVGNIHDNPELVEV